ncbi:MAG: GAF domain-containing sensor histidine kinase [Anaerolineae bacterium]|nr:GAF domain-containing sensor histidine kinase [Anaerolineae bacterium]
MKSNPPQARKAVQLLANHSLWIIVLMLSGITMLHYLTPQIRVLSPQVETFLSRHAVERIIFILPIAGATLAFGQAGGLVTLTLTVLIMLPRVLFLSPYPLDALIETAATAIVGYLVVWMIEIQENEKRLRQKAVEKLAAVNAIALTIGQSLDLDEILSKALDGILNDMEVCGPNPGGAIFLLNWEDQSLSLRIQQLSPEWAQDAENIVRTHLADLLAHPGQVIVGDRNNLAHSPECPPPPGKERNGKKTYGKSGLWAGEPRVPDDQSFRSRVPADWEEWAPYVVVPLVARDRLLGAMLLGLQPIFEPQDSQLLASIGSQVGVAVENARLYENLRFYVREITRAQENERQRIAQELHDETIQTLVAISRRLEALTTGEDQIPAPVIGALERLQNLTSSAVAGIRRFVQDLRPSVLDHLGLTAALGSLVDDLVEKEGIDARLVLRGETKRLQPEEELALFRIVQEALNNVRRHSGASQATVELDFRSDSAIHIAIRDNGRGFPIPERINDLMARGRLGLVGMRERARNLGGTLSVQSGIGQGTTVLVDLPLQR